ncbi:Hypothetical protein FKW44_012642 [Caligus rogercresseyi]|uniref:Uncharacterized protein n=1 Tax=Caligus rogercresseyi TaxID=217165 RepID=A0A7T8HJR6_CALRO|nr:Hypothetical protein FKW44_012642 [Caligus rogercresseyi]
MLTSYLIEKYNCEPLKYQKIKETPLNIAKENIYSPDQVWVQSKGPLLTL